MTFETRRERVLTELQATGDGFLNALAGISEVEWSFKRRD